MNLVQESVQAGGKLAPLILPQDLTNGTGLMNPSIYIDGEDILVNLRHVNYTLYHSEHEQYFPSVWGPLAYLHPESYQKLATTNFLCRLNSDLEMTDYTKVDTSTLDVEPLWEFVGLEDCRVVRWEGHLFLIGVRRDTTTNGQGRMELSEIDLDKDAWTAKEIARYRIPTPFDVDSYCEKNWVPVLDRPFHMVKWTCPTELVHIDPFNKVTHQVSLKEGVQPSADQRGGSQVLRWGEHYIAITHEVNLFNNYLGQKDGIYRHRLVVWDEDFTPLGLSEPFSFLEARIEFVAGAAAYNGDLLVSFGFQDNAAFVLQVPGRLIDSKIQEALNA